MAVLLAKASGNWTDSTTWGVVDVTSYLNAENATESLLTTAYSGTRSSAFTPGAITIDGIAVKLCERIGTTGTMSVCLELDSDNSLVTGTEVTINTADLPSALETDSNGGWIFFKFAAPVLLLAATAYQVAAKTSSSSMVDLWCDGTADNLARCLRTTTEAAPTTGDDMIITGEKTGAGAETAITVTMNGTATTDFGAAPTAANSLILPGLAICDGGTLTYGTTAATNYYLKMSNSVIVYSGGILNIGTTGTPVPRDSTAVLEFDPAADGDYGLIARNLSTLNIQGLSRTSGKNIVSCKLNTDEAANSTSLGVDTDTGWLDNDEIAVASTTRTATQTEKGTLNGNAGASSLTVDGFAGTGGGLLNAHSGTSPTQAEVILLTRNVKIRSATSTLMAYVNIKATATVDIDWAEFYYIGENATSKRGIEVETTTGSFNMQYSSIHDTEDGGFYSIGNSGSIVFSNNNFWNAANAALLIMSIASTTGSHTITNNISVGGGNISSHGFSFSDMGSTITGNTVAGANTGATLGAITINDSLSLSFDNNTIHSNNGYGLYVLVANIHTNTYSNCNIWRNNAAGIALGAAQSQHVFNTCVLFGNSTNNILATSSQGLSNIIFKSCTVNGDTTFSTTNGINLNVAGVLVGILLIDCNFSTVSGIKTAHTTDIVYVTGAVIQVTAINTILAASTETTTITSLSQGDSVFFRSHKHDQSATLFQAKYIAGTIVNDTTVRHTASGYSWKLTPANASRKLRLPGPSQWIDTFKAAVNASSLVTIKAFVYKDSSYNGNAPRLVLLGGIIGGIASDVTDSLTVAHSNWEELEVTGTPNEAGVVEFYVDCDGTAGNVYVDDITISQA